MPERPVLIASVQAWAKINLDLRILASEENGFHQLETIFQRIALADDVEVRVRDGAGITLTCETAVGVPEEQNLAWRAAAAYRHAATWPPVDRAIDISLTKRIPTGAGLGGGSADAGAVLRILNALNPKPLDPDTLLTVASTLGADVAFLTTECVRALAWGRGERLLALDPLPQRMVRYAAFRDGVDTAMAYRELAAARSASRIPPLGSVLLDLHGLGSWSDLQRHARNDFEVPVFALRPDIAAVPCVDGGRGAERARAHVRLRRDGVRHHQYARRRVPCSSQELARRWQRHPRSFRDARDGAARPNLVRASRSPLAFVTIPDRLMAGQRPLEP